MPFNVTAFCTASQTLTDFQAAQVIGQGIVLYPLLLLVGIGFFAQLVISAFLLDRLTWRFMMVFGLSALLQLIVIILIYSGTLIFYLSSI